MFDSGGWVIPALSTYRPQRDLMRVSNHVLTGFLNVVGDAMTYIHLQSIMFTVVCVIVLSVIYSGLPSALNKKYILY